MVYTYFLLGIISSAIMLISVIIITISYGRFSKGEFKRILKWLIFSLYFIVGPYVLYTGMELGIFENIREVGGWIIFFIMIIPSLFLIRTALLLDRFSKVFGFAKPEEKFAEAFIKGVKKVGGE